MSQKLPIGESDLHAYVDGELTRQRSAEVEAWLAARPDEAARVAAYRELGEQWRHAYEHVLREPVPVRLESETGRGARRPRVGKLTAAVALAALLGGVVAWHARDWLPASAEMHGPALVQRAAVAHAVYSPDMGRPVELRAEAKQQLLDWLSRRLGMKVEAPELASAGFTLVGGRLLPGGSAPAGLLMYEAADGRRVTFYWSPETTLKTDTGLRFTREKHFEVFYWIDRECGYAFVSADLPREDLRRLAEAAHDQLEEQPR